MPVNTFSENNGQRQVELHNGVKMPIFGLGTSHSGGYSQSAVVYALQQCNYRLIDTAKRYGCEEFLQDAIKTSGVPREEIFLTTKLWSSDFGSATTRKAFFGSLKRLGTNYLDLFMIHWPLCCSSCDNKAKALEETWREIEMMYDEGLCRAIGVSNYYIDDLVNLMETASVIPHVNQVEFHPFQNPIELREFCCDHNIQVEGYCPLGKGKILQDKVIVDIAEKYNRTPAQVLIRWSIQNGVITIPKSTKEERVKQNSEVFDFYLSEADMDKLGSLHDGRRVFEPTVIQKKIDQCLPDGYKLNLTSEEIEKLDRL